MFKKAFPWNKLKRRKEEAFTTIPHHVGTSSVPSNVIVGHLSVPGDPSLRQPLPPPITNMPDGRSECTLPHPTLVPSSSILVRGSAPPPDQAKFASSETNATKKVTKYMKAILRSLGDLTGAPVASSFIDSLDLGERDDMKRKDLEHQCGRFITSIQSIESLTEKEGITVPESLKVSLDRLTSELASISHKIANSTGDAIDIESMSHEISLLLESFLFENHVVGFIRMPKFFEKVNTHALSQAIRDLPRTDAAYNDYASGGKKRVLCFERTREALLADIGKWIKALDETRIYSLSGLAGIGKSTVTQTVAARADEFGYLGASFFFSRDEAARKNAKKFFTTIAFQLCAYDEEFARAIGGVLATERGAAATSKEPLKQLNRLIVEPLCKLVRGRTRPLVLVVDALDECDDEDGLVVLSALDHLVRELPAFKVILTTRPQQHLDLFAGAASRKVFYLQNIEDKIVDHDIQLYLQYRLSCEQVKSQLNLKTLWSANKEEIESLVRATGRLFIIASTAVLFILDKAARNPASQMKKLQIALSNDRTPFNALNEFYTVILRCAVPTDCDPDIVERYQAVIGTIVVVQDPLPIAALANLIRLCSEDVRAVLDNLQSVILLGDDDIPRVYHKSFPDYIKDTTRCKDKDLQIVPRNHHTQITICCFDCMNMRLRRNILSLGTPAQYMDNSTGLNAEGISDDQLREKVALELRYACIYWANHFEGADIKDINLIKKVDGFAKERLVYWLEALSWICKLELAPRALLTVLDLLVMYPMLLPTKLGTDVLVQKLTSETHEIFFDAFRFISKSYDVIQRSALHVYHSALPFTPTKILLSNVYKKEDNLCQLGGGPERWDTLIAILTNRTNRRDNHRDNGLAFSPDSSHLALWGQHMVKLWDATSGAPVKTFSGDKIALAGGFTTVALSKDNTLTLYNVASNAPIANYKPSARVVELALSFDGSRLVTALSDGTVSLWDSRGVGGSIASLDGYALKKGQLEFAPRGYHLAFLSDDGGIRLWNGFNGECIALLSYESEEHVKFVFSHSGSRLAALTMKNDLTLWNGENGKLIGVALDVGWDLAISNDASLIATGGWTERISDDGSWVPTRLKKVQLWSGDSLSLVDTLEIANIFSLELSHDMLAIGCLEKLTLYDLQTRAVITSVGSVATPACLALSPSRLAAVTVDGEIPLWDVQSMKASTSESTKNTRIVTALAFSPDCLRLASGFRDGTVELWDIGCAGQVTAALKLHCDEIAALAFSADGEQLASGSMDRTVWLWGARDGAPTGRLVFMRAPNSLAFSGRLLAVQMRDDLTLFDSQTRRRVHTLNAGGHHLSSSSDGSLIAYVHSSTDVMLWSLKTRTLLARFKSNPDLFQKLVFSPDGSQLAALTSLGFQLFDVINKRGIANPEHKEISWIFQNRTLISRPSYSGYGEPLLGHFPEHRGGVPVLWMPRDVGITAFTVESSKFALGCSDGHLMIGHMPPALTA